MDARVVALPGQGDALSSVDREADRGGVVFIEAVVPDRLVARSMGVGTRGMRWHGDNNQTLAVVDGTKRGFETVGNFRPECDDGLDKDAGVAVPNQIADSGVRRQLGVSITETGAANGPVREAGWPMVSSNAASRIGGIAISRGQESRSGSPAQGKACSRRCNCRQPVVMVGCATCARVQDGSADDCCVAEMAGVSAPPASHGDSCLLPDTVNSRCSSSIATAATVGDFTYSSTAHDSFATYRNYHHRPAHPHSHYGHQHQHQHLKHLPSTYRLIGAGSDQPLPCNDADMSHQSQVHQQASSEGVEQQACPQSSTPQPARIDQGPGPGPGPNGVASPDDHGTGVRGSYYGPDYGHEGRSQSWSAAATAWPPATTCTTSTREGPRLLLSSRVPLHQHPLHASLADSSLAVDRTTPDNHRFHGNGNDHSQHLPPPTPQGPHSQYSCSAHPSTYSNQSHPQGYAYAHPHPHPHPHPRQYPHHDHSMTQQPPPYNHHPPQHHFAANPYSGPPGLYRRRYPPYPGTRPEIPPVPVDIALNDPYSFPPQPSPYPQYPPHQPAPWPHQGHHAHRPPPGSYPPWPADDLYHPQPMPPRPLHAPDILDPYSGGPTHGPPPHYSYAGGPYPHHHGDHPHPLPLPPLRSSHQYRNSALFANAASASDTYPYPVAGSDMTVGGRRPHIGAAHGSVHMRHLQSVGGHDEACISRDETDQREGEEEEQTVLADRLPPISTKSASAVNGRDLAHHAFTDPTDDRDNAVSRAWLVHPMSADNKGASRPPPIPYSAEYPPNDTSPVQRPQFADSLPNQPGTPAPASTQRPTPGHVPGIGGQLPPGPQFGFNGPAGYLGFDHLFPGGNPLLRRRDYFVFTAITYELMVRAIRVDRNLPEYPEGIEHAISSSVALTAAHHPAGLTRKKWIRLKGRLELHADRGPRRCLTWKGCPLIIVPEDDWAQVIKSVHVLTGRPGIHASHKLTYSLIRKEYQTRRSRCGIPQEMITDFCTMCAECASGVFVTDTCPESTRNSEQDQDNDQGSGEDERGTSDEDQVDGVGGSAAGPNRPKQPAVANLSSGVTLPTLGRPGKRKATAAAASPLAPNVGGQAAEQGESGRPRAPKRQRVDTADDGTGVQAGHEDSQAE